uniref:Uncharacterized protein n=1 Tax=Dunaliella tertiolecta TaxID=3047 RepID=A0A6S8NDN1_DUNTE
MEQFALLTGVMENKYRDFNTLWTTKGAWGEQIWASLRGERACLCTFSFNASSLEAIQGQEREGCVAVPAYKGSLALACFGGTLNSCTCANALSCCYVSCCLFLFDCSCLPCFLCAYVSL